MTPLGALCLGFGFLAHHLTSDLAHLVLDATATVRAIVHRIAVGLDQEGWCRCPGRQPFLLSNSGELFIVLARPINVHAARDAVPLGLRRLGAAVRTLHAGSS